MLRTKPGRADAPPTRAMSCSDKLAAWAVLGAVPGALGIATWSPRLDERGNSRRGIGIFEGLSARWDLHVLQHRGALRGLRASR